MDFGELSEYVVENADRELSRSATYYPPGGGAAVPLRVRKHRADVDARDAIGSGFGVLTTENFVDVADGQASVADFAPNGTDRGSLTIGTTTATGSRLVQFQITSVTTANGRVRLHLGPEIEESVA